MTCITSRTHIQQTRRTNFDICNHSGFQPRSGAAEVDSHSDGRLEASASSRRGKYDSSYIETLSTFTPTLLLLLSNFPHGDLQVQDPKRVCSHRSSRCCSQGSKQHTLANVRAFLNLASERIGKVNVRLILRSSIMGSRESGFMEPRNTSHPAP